MDLACVFLNSEFWYCHFNVLKWIIPTKIIGKWKHVDLCSWQAFSSPLCFNIENDHLNNNTTKSSCNIIMLINASLSGIPFEMDDFSLFLPSNIIFSIPFKTLGTFHKCLITFRNDCRHTAREEQRVKTTWDSFRLVIVG